MTKCFRDSCNENTENKYCSTSCSNKDRAKIDVSGTKNPNWKGGKSTYECEICGEVFSRHESQVRKDSATLCSRGCLENYLSKTNSGPQNPLWQGGSNFTAAIRTCLGDRCWQTRSTEVREESLCEICGTNKDLVAHHIVPVCCGGTNEDYNMMVLCRTHHRKAENFTKPKINNGIY